MPDKTTPHIEKAIAALMENYGYDRDGEMPEWAPASAERDARAVLSTTLEPSEAEIEAAAMALWCNDDGTWEGVPDVSDFMMTKNEYRDQARACLIAAARVRIGQK
jgi:hypothetical protein